MHAAGRPILRKTDKAHQELRLRLFGLSPRARQLLILIDGRRRREDLARMLPEPELGATLSMLQEQGFVEFAEDAERSAPARITPAGTASALQAQGARVARALVEAIGPSGDEFATRLERCTAPEELRLLLPAAASVVEAAAGREASERFIERVGRL